MRATLPSTLTIEPAGIRVLVLPDTFEDGNEETDTELKTKGGIIIAKESDYAKDRERERVGQVFGTVAAIGPLAWQDYDRFASREGGWTQWAKVGDRVSYARYSGDRITDPETGVEFIVMNDNDINAVIHSDKENIDGRETDGSDA